MRLRVSGIVLACLPMFTAAAQTSFRADVKLIDVSVSVRDSEGRLVSDLGQDDFDISEDGAPQKIAFFARSQDVPLNLGLIVDFSGSQEQFIKPHHKDLETFLASVLGPADRAFLLCFGNYLHLANEFTSSPKELLAGLQAFEKGNRGFPELGPAEDRAGGTAFFDAIYYSSAEMLSHVEHGRRALIVFSDGQDNSSAHNMMEALETAQSNDVVLYGIRYTEVKNGRLNSNNKYGIGVMGRLARDTGGADFDARKTDMASEFKSIGEQLRSSYELAYHSSNPASDGLFRKISVTVKRPGVAVRAKTGYYAR
jgi:Ca-activated chloride channel family protein